ncbi:phosphoheptose isomerase 2 [Spirochaetia bacterium]|nr:phosphoheptose isomerase 2 [Spirochaetia bacterium]
MDYLQQLITRYPALSDINNPIQKAADMLIESFENRRKLLIAGNGGSAADADHIAGELMKGFVKKRYPPPDFAEALRKIDPEAGTWLGETLQGGLPAISLSGHTALLTATLNDADGKNIYAQQVYGYGASGDVFLGISTSGKAKNIIYAMITAKAKNLKTIALTGGTGGPLVQFADVSIIVPETETYKIQELHLPVYHTLCLMVEDHFFK